MVAAQLSSEWGDEAACRAELVLVQRLRGMLDAHEARVVARLAELERSLPEAVVAEVQRVGLGAAGRVTQRARVIEQVPELGSLLAAGGTSGSHLDVVAAAVRGLSPGEQAAVAAHGARLAAAAASQSRREFESTVRRVVTAVVDDGGVGRLERQRRAARLRTWVDRASGMWCLRGEFDPESGARLDARLRATADRLAREGLSSSAPTDPVERSQFVDAAAFVRLVEGTAPAGATTDLTVLIDARTLLDGAHPDSMVDTGVFGLPIETVRRWACSADITPVVVAPGGQQIMAGRTIRVANAAQRRVLRVLYRGCALCDTRFEHCQIHHVRWHGRDLGRTDIDNLLPLCTRHHHAAHEGGWRLSLAADRTLTVHRPDGTVSIHAPPTVRAAA